MEGYQRFISNLRIQLIENGIPMLILIVEDNPITAKMLKHNMQKHGHQTLIASTGKEALEFLNTSPEVQLVITDIIMPQMNGLELLGELNAKPEWKTIPVIICTSVKDEETVRKTAELGCTDYLTKPINLDALLAKVANFKKKEKPVIQDRNKIRMRLLMDYDGYKELDAMFSTLVLEKIEMVEDQIQRGYPDDISDSLLELKEGASLLGAERLKSELNRLESKKKAHDEKALKETYARLLRELKVIQNHLMTKAQVTVRYELPEDSRVTLFIYRHKGPMVRRLVDEDKVAGIYEVTWNGCDDKGTRLPSGLYLINLKAGTNVQERVFQLE